MASSTLTWLADKLLERGRHRETKVRDQWDRVAKYFDEIADTLEKMIAQFRQKQIPRVEGNKLEVLIGQFTQIVHSIYSPDDDADRKQVHKLLSELYQAAEAAANEDIQHIAIGYIEDIGYSSAERIAQIERAAGKFRGLAAALRAATP